MKFEKIMLDGDDENGYLDAYIADPICGFERKAILIIPGGGYSQICSEREGEPIAHAFIPHGYNAFVLHYSADGTHPFPCQLIQVAKAIKHIKDNCNRYGISAEKVFVVGFSAGGHLAASSGILWNLPEIYEKVPMPYGYNKPSGIMLIYPVISAKYHMPSLKNLLCESDPTQEQLDRVSMERYVNKDSVPAFIFHTTTDKVVSVKNSLSIAEAYTNAEIPYEMHIYPDAPHGIALANEITECGNPKWNNAAMAKWVEMAAYWADNYFKA